MKGKTISLIGNIDSQEKALLSIEHSTAQHKGRHSAVLDDNARVDIRASGFWKCLHHYTFFDGHVFNSFTASYRSTNLAAAFRRHEIEKVSCL